MAWAHCFSRFCWGERISRFLREEHFSWRRSLNQKRNIRILFVRNDLKRRGPVAMVRSLELPISIDVDLKVREFRVIGVKKGPLRVFQGDSRKVLMVRAHYAAERKVTPINPERPLLIRNLRSRSYRIPNGVKSVRFSSVLKKEGTHGRGGKAEDPGP